jgi:pentose-5-phosphate-3-epimerase
VDGGIITKLQKLAIHAGADIWVAGSYTFHGDIRNNIKSLKEIK